MCPDNIISLLNNYILPVGRICTIFDTQIYFVILLLRWALQTNPEEYSQTAAFLDFLHTFQI